jgi:hypothetical protein
VDGAGWALNVEQPLAPISAKFLRLIRRRVWVKALIAVYPQLSPAEILKAAVMTFLSSQSENAVSVLLDLLTA